MKVTVPGASSPESSLPRRGTRGPGKLGTDSLSGFSLYVPPSIPLEKHRSILGNYRQCAAAPQEFRDVTV
eukprot:313555-Rhodomonas_salina.1